MNIYIILCRLDLRVYVNLYVYGSINVYVYDYFLFNS